LPKIIVIVFIMTAGERQGPCTYTFNPTIEIQVFFRPYN